MAVAAGAKPGRKTHLAVVTDAATATERSGRIEFDPEAPAEPDWADVFPSLTDRSLDNLDRPALIALAVDYEISHAANIGTDRLRARVAAVASTLSPQQTLRLRAQNTQNDRCRRVASEEWARVVPVLDARGRLAAVDRTLLVDYCTVVARIDQGERALSIEGLWVAGERGAQKNPWTTSLSQYRTQLKGYLAELGLSPGSRLPATSTGDDELHGNWG